MGIDYQEDGVYDDFETDYEVSASGDEYDTADTADSSSEDDNK